MSVRERFARLTALGLGVGVAAPVLGAVMPLSATPQRAVMDVGAATAGAVTEFRFPSITAATYREAVRPHGEILADRVRGPLELAPISALVGGGLPQSDGRVEPVRGEANSGTGWTMFASASTLASTGVQRVVLSVDPLKMPPSLGATISGGESGGGWGIETEGGGGFLVRFIPAPGGAGLSLALLSVVVRRRR